MGNSRHHGELLVWIGKKIEKRLNVLKGGDPIVLAASNQDGTFDFARVAQRQALAHIDVGPVWHGVIEGTWDLFDWPVNKVFQHPQPS